MGVTRQHQVLAHDGALAGPPAAQPHRDVLLPRGFLRRPFLLEPAQPGHRGLVPGRHAGVVGGLLPQGADQLLQLLVLLVPAAAQFLQAADPVSAGLGVVPEAATVHPDVPVLDGHDAPRAGGQQFPVVADQQHGLGRGGQLLLEPALARHVQVVVRLVEQQDAVGAAQQRLENQPLLLAAGQRAHVAPAALLVRDAERGHRAGVPVHLGTVAPGLAPCGQRRSVAQLGALVVALHHGQLGRVQRGRGFPHPRWRNGKQQVTDHGRDHQALVGADELAHDAEPAGGHDRARLRRLVPSRQPQQGGLAGSVRPDQGGRDPLADAEAHVVQQCPPVRQHMADVCHLDVPPCAHPRTIAAGRRADNAIYPRPPPAE
jgi:hypothetical protein